MKLRRKNAPLVLLLVPFASALSAAAQDNIASTLTKHTQDKTTLDTNVSTIPGPPTKAKYGTGTKDAPVDGRDGKPHAGPFVGIENPQATAKVEAPLKGSALIEEKADLIGSDGTKIPQSNDGVMDDPARQLPKHGTTGTEGGVSEKDKVRQAQEGQTGEKLRKTPNSPKEVPPLPVSEESMINKEKTKVKEVDDTDDVDGLAGFEKPDDLPKKLNNLPHPLPDSANKDHLDISTPNSKSNPKYDMGGESAEGLIQPLHSYVLSLTMILFSEIGDKTFLIAALMAMKHDRLLVFSAALSALITMTILSAVLGHAVPTLIPKRFTNFLASGLFLIFGARLMREGLAMDKNEGVGAEMQEVEQELAEQEVLARQQGRRRSSASPYELEMGLGLRRGHSGKPRSGTRLPSPPRSPSSSPDRSLSPPPRSTVKGALVGINNLLSLLLSPAWVQTFVMTFLGEWGDRSQIATIAMAAGQDYWWVTGGAINGHAICTGVAVIGGRAIAGKVSMRVVTLGGAGAFLVFGVIYLVEAVWYA
ncbi:UPF0016-domain-containing protein [Calycina marina]|uniref:UPF0016-domain-containing protein n=1 Tax=Calycina marina TaxID=1763456 RepID=A0A9P8CC80_9HELO|nr:UPF0016-domain-containing protein [Calycina marina]